MRFQSALGSNIKLPFQVVQYVQTVQDLNSLNYPNWLQSALNRGGKRNRIGKKNKSITPARPQIFPQLMAILSGISEFR
jgi:hypothetical protein